MALRSIVVKGDDILTKKCRKVDEVNKKIVDLMDDMIETMRRNDGIGIAAPQVGMLKAMCVIGPFEDKYYEMINPKILAAEGEQEGYEGCLSVPGYVGCVKRPEKVKVKAQDRTGEWKEYTFEGFAAVAASHEIDHLSGIMYTSKATDVHKVPKKDESEPEAK